MFVAAGHAAAAPASVERLPVLAPMAPGAIVPGLSPQLSAEALSAWHWTMQAPRTPARAFAIVDKRSARLHVFTADGAWAGSAPALLGLARGDDAAEGLGQMAPADIPPRLRTTPAGHFVSRPGRNLQGERVLWFDHAAGLAIHRLRPAAAQERRPQRLSSSGAKDNRITLGCVVVEGRFFDEVVIPVLGQGPGTVLVLPEDRPVASWLKGLNRPEPGDL